MFLYTGFAVGGLAVDGLAVVGFTVAGFAVVGFTVAGFAVVGFAVVGFAVAGFAVLVRMLTALGLQRRLSQSSGGRWVYAWLVPVKDILQAAIWLLAFLGNSIEWRGRRMRLRRDGTLDPQPGPGRG